jgi:hypothetical protein
MEIWLANQHAIEETLRQMHAGAVQYRIFQPNNPTRWDQLSYAFYGNPWLEEILVRANPEYLGQVWLPAGAQVRVPEIETRPWVDPNSLPPWDPRRQQWRK